MTILLAILCCLPQEFPEPRGYINDHVGVMQAADVQKLNSVIKELKQKTGAELAVLILPTVKPMGIDSYANTLMGKWSVGSAKDNNGVILVIAIQDKRWAVRTGYGVEGELPDSKVGSMGRDYFTPLFRQGKYSEGVVNFSAAILGILAKKYDVTLTGAPKARKHRKGRGGWSSVMGLIVFVVIIGSMFGRRGRGGMWPLLLLFGMSGGGWRGGGGGGFGGGGGGGFGGFGGGSFGGGGASGSW